MTFLLPPGSKGFKDHGIELHWFLVFYLNRCTVFLASPKLVYLKLRYRSSHRSCSRECVLKHFAKFTGKYLWQSLFFNNFLQASACNFLKKILWHRCFLVNFVKISRALFYRIHPGNCFCKPIIACINSFHDISLFPCPKNRKPEAWNGLLPDLFLRTSTRDYLHFMVILTWAMA